MRETSARLLRLLTLLQARPAWTGPELAERLGVTTRTVRADVERLRSLDYGIDAVPGPGGGYRLGPGTALPPLLLDDEEAIAVAIGLGAATGGGVSDLEEPSLRALTKLRRLLPSRLRHRVDAVDGATVAVPARGPAVDTATLTAVASAIHVRERLRFDYRAPGGESTRREVEPHRLVSAGRRWYLLAWDVDRADWRTFRADRLTPRTPNGPRFVPRVPPADAVTHVVRGVASRAWTHPARVRLHAPLSRLAGLVPAMAGVLHDDGTLETGGESLASLAAFLVGLDVPFTVLDPPELREHLRALAARLAEG